jgi:hypothetical protein
LIGIKTLHRIALGILFCCKDYLLKQCHNASDILNFLIHIPRGLIHANQLIVASLKHKITRADIVKTRILTQEKSL